MLAQVAYEPPNPNGEPKACANCFLWVRSASCLIHDRKIRVGAQAWCSHHIFGQPHNDWEPHNIRPVDPKLSGLRRAPGGVACDGCTFYEPVALEGGLCFGTTDGAGGPGRVEAKGACARHTPIRIGMPSAPPMEPR